MSGVKRLCHRPQTDHEIKPLLTSFREQLMFGADARIAQNLCLCERLTLHKLVVYVVCETRSEPSLCIRWEKRPANPCCPRNLTFDDMDSGAAFHIAR